MTSDELIQPHNVRQLLSHISQAQEADHYCRFPRFPLPPPLPLADNFDPTVYEEIAVFEGRPIMLPSELLDVIASVIDAQHKTIEEERDRHRRQSVEQREEISRLQRELAELKARRYDEITGGWNP